MNSINLNDNILTFLLESGALSLEFSPKLFSHWRESLIPKYQQLWGPGGTRQTDVIWENHLTGDLRLNWYHRMRGFVLSGVIVASDFDRIIRQIPLFTIKMEKQRLGQWRILQQSGHQGFSGSLPLGDQTNENPLSQDLVFLANVNQSGVLIGNLSFNRTNIIFFRQKISDDSIQIQAYLDYGRMCLPAGKELVLEDILILSGRNGLGLLEEYADCARAVARPVFDRSLTGLYNQWYANWTPTSDHGSAELAIEGAKALLSSPFYSLGVALLGSGVWHNRARFGEEQPWPNLFPGGLEGLAKRLGDLGAGFMHGGFWGKISQGSTVFMQHPEWMARDLDGQPMLISSTSWGACDEPYFLLDITISAAQKWLRDQWLRIAEISSGFFWLDFYGSGMDVNLAVGTKIIPYFQDNTLSFPFEIDRLMTRIIREAVGSQGIIGVYTSPTLNLIGLIDRARVGMDCGALDPPGGHEKQEKRLVDLYQSQDRRWGHIQAVARNLAANYYYHDRFWMNDADPIMVGLEDHPGTLEEARVRLMLSVNAGSFVTLGEQIDKIPPGRVSLLKKALPACGIAARPIDLLNSATSSVYDLHLITSWDDWHVVTIMNWTDIAENKQFEFRSIGIGGTQHVYEFWDQRYLGTYQQGFSSVVPPRSCRVYCLRPVRAHPWLLSSSFHVTQDILSLKYIRWNPDSLCLSGELFRPVDCGELIITVPDGFQVLHGLSKDQEAEVQVLAKELVSIPLQSDGSRQTWKLYFDMEKKSVDLL